MIYAKYKIRKVLAYGQYYHVQYYYYNIAWYYQVLLIVAGSCMFYNFIFCRVLIKQDVFFYTDR